MCIKGTTTTHLPRRRGRVETEEGWVRDVVSHDTLTTPPPSHTLLTQHRKRTVIDPANSLGCCCGVG